MAMRSWATLACDWFTDPVLQVIGEDHPAVFALWPVLVARCVDVSHAERNPHGSLETSTVELGKAINVDRSEVAAILSELVDGEALEVDPTGKHGMVIRLARFAKWQKPRGSSAKYKREQRHQEAKTASRENVAESPQVVHDLSPTRQPTSTNTSKHYVPNGTLSADPSDQTQPKQPSESADLQAVFDHWLKVAAPIQFPDPGRVKLTAGRRRVIATRFRAGYTATDLRQAIDGFTHDPFHRGDNDRATPYLDLKTIFRSDEKVDEGIRLAQIADGNRGASSTQVRAMELVRRAQEG